ncbi:MAG: DegT/DnrJ/EryC1/StrS aminotransferase family protein [Proteobacteria bacterium]|jgi:dTDP-4-amino-4,6-dideoxygalactose transaminase|nr:DegT/DnrJ/EryC1/StrS aminotransferase family protein [Pseudomonadota bacterium]
MSFLPFTRPSLDDATLQGVLEVLRSGWLATGPQVAAFESALSAYVGGRPVRVMTSATAALEIALLAAGIGPGDEVITPAMSFTATANVILRVGAKPVFVDVDLDTRNMDLALAAAAITPATRALMPVHFAGLPLDMTALYALARQHGLRVIEDAAHAIGSGLPGARIGSGGDLVCFSFHPNKNMTTLEGGALVADDPAELLLIERQRFHGLQRNADGTMDVSLPGGKANLTDVAARVGMGQLPLLDGFNDRRRHLAGLYFEQLADEPLLHLPARGDAGHSWHMFAPLLDLPRLSIGRAQFIELMRQREIGVGVHYPAIHLFSCYQQLGWKAGDFPNAERIGEQTVTLPLFPAMADSDVARVCDALRTILREHAL